MSDKPHSTDEPAEEDAAAEPGTETESQQSFWSSFTRADMRVLAVTFAGTVVANILTVMIVAVALVLDRSKFARGRPNLGLVLLLTGLVVAAAVAVGANVVNEFRENREGSKLRRIYRRVLLLATALGGTVLLLVLLGYALGVK